MNVLPGDHDFLADTYASARNRYKPASVETILLTEAPPDNLDRFFYFEDVKSHDSLFLEVMGVLYPEQKGAYLKAGRLTEAKRDLLERFQHDGYWLHTASMIPLSLTHQKLQDCVPSVLHRLQKYISKSTSVILIQACVHAAFYPTLRDEGYNVWPEKIPFPGSGQQRIFRQKFAAALAQRMG